MTRLTKEQKNAIVRLCLDKLDESVNKERERLFKSKKEYKADIDKMKQLIKKLEVIVSNVNSVVAEINNLGDKYGFTELAVIRFKYEYDYTNSKPRHFLEIGNGSIKTFENGVKESIKTGIKFYTPNAILDKLELKLLEGDFDVNSFAESLLVKEK